MRSSSASFNALGLVKRYQDALGNWREAPAETCAAVAAAMGQPEQSAEEPVLIVRRGRRKRLRAPAEITLEDGGRLKVETTLPPDLPLGYHTLRYRDRDQSIRLIVSPGACYLPEDLRVWGWSAQLYGLRSSQSWGMGDFADLQRLARWSAKEGGAGVLLVNPLQSASPVTPQQASPYFPSSRRYRNLLYLRIEDVAAAGELGLDLERFAAAGRALNQQRRIDRDAVFKLKMAALQLLWSRFAVMLALIASARSKVIHSRSLPPSVFSPSSIIPAGMNGRPTIAIQNHLRFRILRLLTQSACGSINGSSGFWTSNWRAPRPRFR